MKQLKALQLLEKMKQAQIDEVIPIVKNLTQQYSDISSKIDKLLEQADQEKQTLLNTGAANDHAIFGKYYSGVLSKVEILKKELITVQEKLQIVRAELQEYFSEAKRYEIAAKNIEQREKAESEKKLMDMLDDLAQRKGHLH